MEEAPIVSHGRGGQGNIGPDPTQYADANITRQGPEGDQGDGAYSAGRGGAGNIGSPRVRPQSHIVHDADVVPDLAVRVEGEGEYHTGRGGKGNVERVVSREEAGSVPVVEKEKEREKERGSKGTAEVPEGLADKLKFMIFGRK